MSQPNPCNCGYSDLNPIHTISCPAYEHTLHDFGTGTVQPKEIKYPLLEDRYRTCSHSCGHDDCRNCDVSCIDVPTPDTNSVYWTHSGKPKTEEDAKKLLKLIQGKPAEQVVEKPYDPAKPITIDNLPQGAFHGPKGLIPSKPEPANADELMALLQSRYGIDHGKKWYLPSQHEHDEAHRAITKLITAAEIRQLEQLKEAIKLTDKLYDPYELHLMIDDTIKELKAKESL